MNVSIICIGDELLKGATVNTNLSYIGQVLLKIGVVPTLSLVIPDEDKAIRHALDVCTQQSDVIITTGGLGPTADDVSKNVVADYLGLELEQDEEALDNLRSFWARMRTEPLPERNLRQTLVPHGSLVLQNRVGIAPGFVIEADSTGPMKKIIMLPGPPAEMQPMVSDQVVPLLKDQLREPVYSKLFYLVGLPESVVEQIMQPLLAEIGSGLSVAYCASPESVKLFLSSRAENQLGEAVSGVRRLFDGKLLADASDSLAGEIKNLLHATDSRLATAESCTGGMIAAAITDLPGASDIFPGGLVTYSNESKQRELGVSDELLQSHGAVSEECVTAMVNGVCTHFGTEAGIAVSGIAGPTGGTPEKPLGLVHIAVRFRGQVKCRRCNFRGGRALVRRRAVASALNLLRQLIFEVAGDELGPDWCETFVQPE